MIGSERSTRRVGRRRRLTGGLLALALLAACSESSTELEATTDLSTTTRPSATSAPPTSAPTSSTSLPAVAVDEQLAFDANITVDDLEPGWEECCRPFFMEPDQLAYNTCDDPAIPSNTAGFVREFSFMLDERGVERGHLVAQVYVSATEEDAAKRLDCVGDEQYRAGTIEAAEERSLSKSLVEIGPMSTTYELQELAVGDRTTVDRMRTTYEVIHLGRTGWDHQDSIRMRIGRITYRILVSTYADPLTTQELERWATLFADRAPVG